jgi:hypothetical protein
MMGTMPPVEESPMMGAPPMGPDMGMMGPPPMGMPGFPSTDPQALIMGLGAQMEQDQGALAQQQQQALQIALSMLIESTMGMPDPAAQAAMSEGGSPMLPPAAADVY